MEDDSNKYSIIKNKYQILDFKGKGTYGKVYLVEDINSKKQYAVKILIEKNYDKFKNETNILRTISELKSPYIINMIECGEEKIKIKSEPLDYYQYIILDYHLKENYMLI